MLLVGLTDLSLLAKITFDTLLTIAAFITFSTPNTFVLTDSNGFSSLRRTCFNAAQ